jgi:hypothetical protein
MGKPDAGEDASPRDVKRTGEPYGLPMKIKRTGEPYGLPMKIKRTGEPYGLPRAPSAI